MRIVCHPEAAVPSNLRLQVVRLQELAWPSDGPADLAPWHDRSLRPVSVILLREDGRVVSALDILSKDVVHREQSYAASGISAMVTDPDLRGNGYGRQLAGAALEIMADSGTELGIFTCDRALQPFYTSAGWTHLPGTVIVGGTPEDPFPSDKLGKVTMASFLTARTQQATSDFVGARINLYPGSIDTLW